MRRSTLILTVATILVSGCGLVAPTANPSIASPTAIPRSSGATAAMASPTTAPDATIAPAAPITIPATVIRTLGINVTSASGSRVFAFDQTNASGATRITVGDLATGRIIGIGRTTDGHSVGQVVATTDRVIWVETWRDQPSPPSGAVPDCVDAGKPLRWRIRTLVIETGAVSVVAAGTSVRTATQGECADVDPPMIAADGDRVAFTLEAATPGNLFADQIVVLSLGNGATVRTIRSAGLVRDLGISGQALAYRDDVTSAPGGGSVEPFDGLLMLTTSDADPPSQIDGHVRASTLGGSRIAWARLDQKDGSIWTEDVNTKATVRLGVGATAGFQPDGASQIAAATNAVAWLVDGKDDAGVGTIGLALWSTGGLGPALVNGIDLPGFVAIGDGWLVWSRDLALGVPLSALGVQ